MSPQRQVVTRCDALDDTSPDGPTVAQRAAMARDGYLVVRNFLTLAKLEGVRRWTDELQSAPQAPGRHWVYYEDTLVDPGTRVMQRIENFCPFHAGFDRLVREGKLALWAGELLGGPVVLFKDKINLKMAGAPGFKPHQDQQAGWSRYAPIFITALVSIDPATVENGCLEVVAGRHREGLIGDEWTPLAEGQVTLTPVPTMPGDVIFFNSFVPHASQPNFSASPRRIIYATYNLAEHGDHRARYYADKHAAYPPDLERDGSKTYVFRV